MCSCIHEFWLIPTPIFVMATSQTWCNMPRKFMPAKEKQREKVGGTNWLVKTLHNSNIWVVRMYSLWIIRGSHQRCSIEIGFLRNFAKLTEKHLCQSLIFNRVAGLTPEKKKLWHRCFPVNFAKFLRTPFYWTPPYDWFWIMTHLNSVVLDGVFM